MELRGGRVCRIKYGLLCDTLFQFWWKINSVF